MSDDYAKKVRATLALKAKLDELAAELAAAEQDLTTMHPAPVGEWQVRLVPEEPGANVMLAKTALAEATVRDVGAVHLARLSPTSVFLGCHLGTDKARPVRVAFQLSARLNPHRLTIVTTEHANVEYAR